MKNPLFQTKVGWLLSALGFMLAFQSCQKESDSANPSASASSTNAVVTPPPACSSVCLVAGQHNNVGTVDVATDANGTLFVTYNVNKSGVLLNEVHMDIFSSPDQLKAAKKISGGGAIPGKFTYKAAPKSTSYTFAVSAADVAKIGTNANGCIYIATHAALNTGDTAWGGICNATGTGVSLAGALQFVGANWGTYFEYCKSTCVSTASYTYAWEDLQSYGNDADYNDLVIKSVVSKGATQMSISFTALARGAGYDHKFRFRIPSTGIVAVTGAPGDPNPVNFTTSGGYTYVTVFESTKAALPQSGPSGLANTVPEEYCVPTAERTVVLSINNSFAYNAGRPYEPFISVYKNSDAMTGPADYDLYVAAISGSAPNPEAQTYSYLPSPGDPGYATNVSRTGQIYPNGIVIPSDWKWVKERVAVFLPYTSFNSTTSLSMSSSWTTPVFYPVPSPAYNSNTYLFSCK